MFFNWKVIRRREIRNIHMLYVVLAVLTLLSLMTRLCSLSSSEKFGPLKVRFIHHPRSNNAMVVYEHMQFKSRIVRTGKWQFLKLLIRFLIRAYRYNNNSPVVFGVFLMQ